MIQVFHCTVSRAGQLNPAVIDMHARIAFRVDRQALTEIFSDEAKWRGLGLSFELVAQVEGNDLERAYSMTNSIDHSWTENDGVQVMTAKRCRSTSVGDLAVRDGTTFVVDRSGFSELPPACRPMAAEPDPEPEPASAPRP